MQKSFTLIELLIVLIIIGVLASIAVPQYNAMMDRAIAAEMKATTKSLADAVWAYYQETGKWPGIADVDAYTDSIPEDLGVKVATSKYFYYNVSWHVDPASPGGHVKASYKGTKSLFGYGIFEVCVYSDGSRKYCSYGHPFNPGVNNINGEGWPF